MNIMYTIGHSNRSFDEFISILKYYSIKIVIDVRRWPSSKKYPHFNLEYLVNNLPKFEIDYVWIEDLGGYRKFNIDVPDYGIAKCFESEGFRAYATYITKREDVKKWLKFIEEIAKACTVVLMCSEKYPWYCHRKILSDYFIAKGFKIIHIIDKNYVIEHKLSKCAKIINNELIYE